MKLIRAGAPKARKWSFLKRSWKRIGVSVMVGATLGFGAAAATHDREHFQSAAARSSSKVSEQDQREMIRLQVRNRRLEALVAALRERAPRQ